MFSSKTVKVRIINLLNSRFKMINSRFLLLIIFYLISTDGNSQKRNNIWCFGDSVGVDFNMINSPIPFVTALRTRGSCASIADSVGNIQLYTGYDPTVLIAGADPFKVYNASNLMMLNGDSLQGGSAWYNQSLIVPFPLSNNLYFVFHIGVTHTYGLYYSLVDLSLNGGLGAVTQKNIQLQSFANVDCINGIKHGNGRDWWVIFRKSGTPTGTSNNTFYQYLITPSGINTNVCIQNVGSYNGTNLGKITFSPTGDKMVFNSYAGMLEIYNYDRCTGIISNPVNIFPQTTGAGNQFWGSEFSPNGQVLYVTISNQTSYLFQFDLNAPNIASSIDTLWTISNPGEAIGGLKRGPDGKIYESGPDTSPLAFSYPYSDSLYTMYNMNLGVINFPDSLGTACDFQPYSFYLGGKRTYWGLPNNPDYDMPAFAGSPCDTLVGISEQPQSMIAPQLHIYYHSHWQTAFINASNLQGTKGILEIFDVQGKMVHREDIEIVNGYYTHNFNMSGMAEGMYFVNLNTTTQKISGKLIKE